MTAKASEKFPRSVPQCLLINKYVNNWRNWTKPSPTGLITRQNYSGGLLLGHRTIGKVCIVGTNPLSIKDLTMSIHSKYIKVRAAAEILGVAPNTVRAWGAAGKLREFRHPANGYRLYKREDLEKFLRQIELTATPGPKHKH
jgi:hypothetical protein